MYLISPYEYTGFLKCLWKTKKYFFLRKLEFSGFGTVFFPVFTGLCLQDKKTLLVHTVFLQHFTAQ